jgi:hypothetical protein
MQTKPLFFLALSFLLVACGDDPVETDAEVDTGPDVTDIGSDPDTTADVVPDLEEDPGPLDIAEDLAPDGDTTPDADVEPDAAPAPTCSEAERVAVAENEDLLLDCTAECVSIEAFQDCVIDCFILEGFGGDCARCGAAGAECIITSCAEPCDAGADEDCAECVSNNCATPFIECVGEPTVIPEPTGPLTFFHVVHLIDGLGPVDVYTSLISIPFWHDLPFGESSGAVQAVGGNATIDYHLAGEDGVLTSTSGDFGFGSDDRFTAGAFGSPESILAVTIREDGSEPPDGGARYRYVHAAASLSTTVNLWLANAGEPDDTFLEDVAFGSVSEDATRPAGPHQISIDFDQDGTPDTAFDQGTLTENEGYTFWLAADEAGPFILRTSAAGESLRFDGVPIE